MEFRALSIGTLFVRIDPGISPILRKSGRTLAEVVRGIDPERKIISRDERTVPPDAKVQRIDPISITGRVTA